MQFIKEVGVDWKQTRVLNGEVGEFVTIAREEKTTGNWFLGAITDENPRMLALDFSFLKDGETYTAKMYKDGKNAHWDKNPLDLEITTLEVTNKTKIDVQLAAGGGVAISIIKK